MKPIFFRFVLLMFICTSFAVQAAKKPKMEKAQPVGDKPTISQIEPRGIQNGVETKIKLTGANLAELTGLKFSNKKLSGEILETENESDKTAWIKLTAANDLARGVYDFSLENEKGESSKIKIYVDNLPGFTESAATIPATNIPAIFWGTLNPAAKSDEWKFQAMAGQNFVFDGAAKSIGSKANLILTLFDCDGKLLADDNGFDGGDPLLVYKFSQNGFYKLRVSEKTMAGSADHFYRVTAGEFPFITGSFPLSVATNVESEIRLIGYNLPPNTSVKLKTEKSGDQETPLDLQQFRARKALKVLVTDQQELKEIEPNNLPNESNLLPIPGSVGGQIFGKNSVDVDLFRFEAKAGQELVFETTAAQRGSPLDTKIEILYADGQPVERLVMQAVRDSWINFRSIDANSPDIRVENWTEMELNQFMYLQGEVNRIFRMPQGPDSGFQFYSNAGKRFAYFNTSPMAHAMDEVCYIVEPHPPGTKLVPNGLPVFPIYFANDDDGERKLGSDSRVQFTAPKDGNYLVRVTDSLGRSGERYTYRLSVREVKLDFKVTLNGANPTVPPGSGQEFSFTAERVDGFAGDIAVEISNMPAGFLVSTPTVIQAGHFTANGTIFAAADAKNHEMAQPKITATAMVGGKKVVKEVNSFGKIKVGEAPKLIVSIEPFVESETNFVTRSISDAPLEITIAPGQIVPAWLKIKRSGHDDLVTFTVENLPHGVIVDNIGLSGVLIPKDENERKIFLKAAKWVPETDRLAYCQAKQSGNPTSLPVLIHVRRPASDKVATSEIR